MRHNKKVGRKLISVYFDFFSTNAVQKESSVAPPILVPQKRTLHQNLQTGILHSIILYLASFIVSNMTRIDKNKNLSQNDLQKWFLQENWSNFFPRLRNSDFCDTKIKKVTEYFAQTSISVKLSLSTSLVSNPEQFYWIIQSNFKWNGLYFIVI